VLTPFEIVDEETDVPSDLCAMHRPTASLGCGA